MREYSRKITPEQDGKSVSSFLKNKLLFSSRTITKLKQTEHGLLLNGLHTRTVDILHTGDTLTVTFEAVETGTAHSSVLVPILYEDDDLMIYDKPPHMPVHTSCGHATDTLENVFAAHCADMPCRMRAMNRLDRDTSGCVLVAKNQYVASRLTGSFSKAYRALVVGKVSCDGRIDGRILRPDPVDMRRVVDERGQVAITEYGVIRAGERCSFLQFNLITGRTHQIRVHMASAGHAVLGDAIYGQESEHIARQALHCHSISLVHPVSGASIRVRAPLPGDISAAYEQTMEERAPCEF